MRDGALMELNPPFWSFGHGSPSDWRSGKRGCGPVRPLQNAETVLNLLGLLTTDSGSMLLPFALLAALATWQREISLGAGLLVLCAGFSLLANPRHPRFLPGFFHRAWPSGPLPWLGRMAPV